MNTPSPSTSEPPERAELPVRSAEPLLSSDSEPVFSVRNSALDTELGDSTPEREVPDGGGGGAGVIVADRRDAMPEDEPSAPPFRLAAKPSAPWRFGLLVAGLLFAALYFHNLASHPFHLNRMYYSNEASVSAPALLAGLPAAASTASTASDEDRESVWQGGWRGGEFASIGAAALVAARSDGNLPLYPEAAPKDYAAWKSWFRAAAQLQGVNLPVAVEPFTAPPIAAALLVPILPAAIKEQPNAVPGTGAGAGTSTGTGAATGPEARISLALRAAERAAPGMAFALWGLCMAAAWAAWGRTGWIEWIGTAALAAMNVPLLLAGPGLLSPALLGACLIAASFLLLMSGSEPLFYALLAAPIMAAALLKSPGIGSGMWGTAARVAFIACIACALTVSFLAMLRSWSVPSAALLAAGAFLVMWRCAGMGAGASFAAALLLGVLYWFLIAHPDWAFGLLFALAILLKPILALAAPWLLWRGRWRAAAATVAFAALWIGASVALVGGQTCSRYIRVVLPWAARGDADSENQSLPALVRRVLEPSTSGVSQSATSAPLIPTLNSQLATHNSQLPTFSLPHSPAPPSVAQAMRAASLGVIVAAYLLIGILMRRKASSPRIALEFGLLIAAALAASPLTARHEHVMLLPLWVVLFAALLRGLEGWRRVAGLALFAAGWILYASWIPPDPALRPFWYHLLSSGPVVALVPAVLLILLVHGPAAPKGEASAALEEAAFEEFPPASCARPAIHSDALPS